MARMATRRPTGAPTDARPTEAESMMQRTFPAVVMPMAMVTVFTANSRSQL